MCIKFSSCGKFELARIESLKKGNMAIHKVNTLLCKGRSQGCPEKLRLLNSIINATTLYGAEISGLNKIDYVA